MKGMRKWGVGAVVALTAIGTGAGDAYAQTAQRTSKHTEDLTKAGWYEAEAERYAQAKEGFSKSASYYWKASELRPEGDHRGIQNQIAAGKLWFYEGKASKAIRVLRGAGETALEFGDVETAAEAFLDAAWIAREKGDGLTAKTLAVRAHRLAQSPLIAQFKRAKLLSRINTAEGP